MSEFTYLFRGRKMSGSPEEMQQHFEKWAAWFKELAAKGHMRDPGYPLEATGKVVSGKKKIVNDGPYAEAKDVVGGYIVVEAVDLANAAELSNRVPNSRSRRFSGNSAGPATQYVSGTDGTSFPA